MNTFARITAVVLIVLGILVILSGLALVVTGTLRSLINGATAARPLRAGGLTGLLAVAFIFAEGAIITAAGEGLYLLADISRRLPTS